jgi:GTP-binding protein Era
MAKVKHEGEKAHGTEFRAGFVALIGRPNVGKSTLLNQILGEKIAIASPRPQTTRNRILGVHNAPGAQLVMIDTPGLHRPSGRGRTRLNEFMVGEAIEALRSVDAAIVLTEGATEDQGGRSKGGTDRFLVDAATRYVLEEITRANKPAVLAINKVDLMHDKRRLLPVLEAFGKLHAFSAMVPISAKTGDGVDRVVDAVVTLLPMGKPIFPEEMITDRAERWLGAELIREQLFLLTKKEVPYSVAVTIDTWQERPARPGGARDVFVEATVHVDKEAHKPIVVGQGGRMIREVGTRARHEIGQLLGCTVHLKLFVRVDEGWTADPSKLKDLGYE